MDSPPPRCAADSSPRSMLLRVMAAGAGEGIDALTRTRRRWRGPSYGYRAGLNNTHSPAMTHDVLRWLCTSCFFATYPGTSRPRKNASVPRKL